MAERLVCRCRAETDTVALGERIGARLLEGDLLLLSGPLGAGKTVLVRGIATGAGAEPSSVRSPTFVLHHVYLGRRLRLHHLDLYRLGPRPDLATLDLDTLLETGAVVIEWGELADLTGMDVVRVVLDIENDGTRTVVLQPGAADRLAAAWQASAPRA